jgi:hypothetical protein
VTTLALGTRLASSGGGSVTPIDPPILRRDLLQEDDFFIRLEDNTSKIVLSLGTYDRITTEQGTDLLLTEDSSKFILTVY